MSRKLTILPAALRDLSRIGDWYDQHNSNLRHAFLQSIDESLSQLVENPLQYQVVHGRFRRVPVKRFPYALYYFVSDDAVVVAACIHGRRNVGRVLTRQ